jgi:hypothetical protein
MVCGEGVCTTKQVASCFTAQLSLLPKVSGIRMCVLAGTNAVSPWDSTHQPQLQGVGECLCGWMGQLQETDCEAKKLQQQEEEEEQNSVLS